MFGRKKKDREILKAFNDLQKKWKKVDTTLDKDIEKLNETLKLMEENQRLLNNILESQEKAFESQVTLVVIQQETQNDTETMRL